MLCVVIEVEDTLHEVLEEHGRMALTQHVHQAELRCTSTWATLIYTCDQSQLS